MVNNDQDRDIHVLRYFSSFISVSRGKVINITDPKIEFCPLASYLYKDFKTVDMTDKEALKCEIKKAIESKIRDFGLFTPGRIFASENISIPYGASEMLMFALHKKGIDAAVVVCDGAGTIITESGKIVQAIGARMNSLLVTSPIKEIRDHLKLAGCCLISDIASIDQIRGVERAIQSGYKRIAVTVCGHDSDKFKAIRKLESSGISITILSVCTTGISQANAQEIKDYADIVWSCASLDIRRTIGPEALLQISKQIPVFILTKRGIDFVSSYAENSIFLRRLDKRKQYLISNQASGQRIKIGNRIAYLRRVRPPVLSKEIFAL